MPEGAAPRGHPLPSGKIEILSFCDHLASKLPGEAARRIQIHLAPEQLLELFLQGERAV